MERGGSGKRCPQEWEGDGIGMCLALLGALKALDVGAQDYKGRRASMAVSSALPATCDCPGSSVEQAEGLG